MKAYWCWARRQAQGGSAELGYEDAVRAARRRKGKAEASAELVAVADYNAADVYEEMIERFRELERRVCET